MSVLIEARADYRLAESEALRLLKEYGLTEPPVDPRLVADMVGVKVTFVRFAGEEDQVSGFYDYDENEIVVNRQEAPLRQTSRSPMNLAIKSFMMFGQGRQSTGFYFEIQPSNPGTLMNKRQTPLPQTS